MNFHSPKELHKHRAQTVACTSWYCLYLFKILQSASEVGTIPGEEKLYAIAKKHLFD